MGKRRAPGEGAVFHSAAKGCWIWRAVVGFKPNGKVRYREGRARTRGEAVRKQQVAERAGAGPTAGASATVGEWLEAWLAEASAAARPATAVSYGVAVHSNIAPRLGGVRLSALTTADVTRAWADMASAGYKPGTIKYAAQVLGTALRAAVRAGLIPANPAAGARRPKVEKADVEVFADDEVRAVLAAAAGRRYGAVVVLAAATGMRVGELVTLKWGDFAPGLAAVRVSRTLTRSAARVGPPKSKNGVRTIDLPDFARDSLLPLRGQGDGWVFPDRRGNPVELRYFYRNHYQPLLAAAGVRYRPMHCWRHTHCSRLLAAGVPVPEVAARLGDDPRTVLATYCHWMPAGDTASKVQGIYGGRATFPPPSPPDTGARPRTGRPRAA